MLKAARAFAWAATVIGKITNSTDYRMCISTRVDVSR